MDGAYSVVLASEMFNMRKSTKEGKGKGKEKERDPGSGNPKLTLLYCIVPNCLFCRDFSWCPLWRRIRRRVVADG